MYARNVIPKPDQLMTCPYNPAHQVQHYRMHLHLQKCRKQYPNSSTMSCPFDASHIVRDAELDYHVCTCKKRDMFDNQVYTVDDGVPAREPLAPPAPPVASAAGSNEELWDDEQTTSYVPNLAKQGTHIIRKVKGATRSERRQFRSEGIRNYRPLEN